MRRNDLRVSPFMRVLFIVFLVAHQTDENRGEEHEDKRLKEGDKELKERNHDGDTAAYNGQGCGSAEPKTELCLHLAWQQLHFFQHS